MNKKFERLILSSILMLVMSIALSACGEDVSLPEVPEINADQLSLGGFAVDSVDEENHTIYVTPSKKGNDSLVFEDLSSILSASGGTSAYLATTMDVNDPDIVDWDNKIENGFGVSMKDTSSIAIVIMDEKNRPVAVWQVVNTAAMQSSSSVKQESASSSSDAATSSETPVSATSSEAQSSSVAESSAGSQKVDSSAGGSAANNSSDAKNEGAEGGSSASEEIVDSSSSIESSESTGSDESGEETPSDQEGFSLTALRAVYEDLEIEPVVTDHKVYFELPYGADLTQIKLNSEENLLDLTRAVTKAFKNESGVVEGYSVVAGVQLPGFDDDSFWGSPQKALTKKGSENMISIYVPEGSVSAAVSASQIVLTTVEIAASFGFKGCSKAAAGMLFSGSFTTDNIVDIYDPRSGKTECKDSFDYSEYMNFNQDQVFNARPTGFNIDYSYNHIDGDYQKSLIYVMLLNKEGKVVAIGAIMDDSDVSGLVTVPLEYGSDTFSLLSKEDPRYPIAADLGMSENSEDDIAFIHVVFASSALGNNVANYYYSVGTDGTPYGTVGSSLTVRSFKLNY